MKANNIKTKVSTSLTKCKAFFSKFLPGGRIGIVIVNEMRHAQNIIPVPIHIIGLKSISDPEDLSKFKIKAIRIVNNKSEDFAKANSLTKFDSFLFANDIEEKFMKR